MVQTLEQQGVSNRGAVDDQVDRTRQVQSQFHTRMLYKEVEFLLEFCFVLIVVSSAFIISILARKIQLHIDAYRAWHN